MKGRKIRLMVIVTILIFLAGFVINKDAPPSQESPTIEEIKNNSIDISYNELTANSERYTGKIVFYRGKIVQTMETENDNNNEYVFIFSLKKIVQAVIGTQKDYVLLISIKDPYLGYSDNIISVKYKGKSLQKDDIVDVWGRFEGFKAQNTDLGTEIFLPAINSSHLELVKMAGV